MLGGFIPLAFDKVVQRFQQPSENVWRCPVGPALALPWRRAAAFIHDCHHRLASTILVTLLGFTQLAFIRVQVRTEHTVVKAIVVPGLKGKGAYLYGR